MEFGFREYLSYLTQSTFLSMKGFIVKKIKYSKEFYRVLGQLEESQWYSRDKFKELQDAKLKSLIEHAYENVPHYNKLFKEQDIRPKDIQNTGDLKKVPLLTKEALRANPEDFIARNVNKRLLASGWTTGTTGTPINALRSRESIVFENAILWRQKRWGGINLNCKKVIIAGAVRGSVIIPSYIRRPPFWRVDIPMNQILFSHFHMSSDTLPFYFKKLDEFSPEFIEGFPSALLTLAKYLKKKNRVFPVRAIFTSSEPLYDVHRKEIEEQFKTKVFDLYGQAERVAAATECPQHKGLHVNPEYGVLEIIKDNKDVSDGENGEIVGTGLNNYAMPLIRYRTSDVAGFAKEKCPCGREMPLLEGVEGRLADCIIAPDGRIIPGDGILDAFYGIDNIKKSQVVQEDINNITIKIVKDDKNEYVDINTLLSNIRSYIGDEFRLSAELVDSLFEDETIKDRWVMSKVKMDA